MECAGKTAAFKDRGKTATVADYRTVFESGGLAAALHNGGKR
jgi:hypothetical protein